jgi:hypothetical protein
MSDETHYSDFLTQLSGLTSELSLFCGFTLTVITILVTRLPDPSVLMAQVSLFFLTVMLNLLQFLLGWVMFTRTLFCRYLPLSSIKHSDIFNPLLFACLCMWGLSVVLIYLLFDLTYLAAASAGVWFFFILLAYVFIWGQFKEHTAKIKSS